MSTTVRTTLAAGILTCLVVSAFPAVAAQYERFAVPGWTIVGVWQQNYGIDVQQVIERSKDGEYRLRYVTSKDPKSTKGPKTLRKEGSKYTIVGARFGDYMVMDGSELKTYDNDGYIDTLKPMRP